MRRWAALAFVLLASSRVALADTVVLRDGTSIDGKVIGFESDVLAVRLPSGEVRRVPRAALLRVEFGEEVKPTALPAVEVKIVDADDSLEIFLNGAAVVGPADKSDWTPVQSKLADGNNELRIKVTNARGAWAYHWGLRIAGKAQYFRCGEPRRASGGCRQGGRKGTETGILDDLPSVWVHCASSTGLCEAEESAR